MRKNKGPNGTKYIYEGSTTCQILQTIDKASPATFKELCRALGTGPELSSRLSEAKSKGLIEKVPAQYKLTKKGRECLMDIKPPTTRWEK